VEARFSALVQTGPGVHPASCTMGTGSFPEVNSCRGVTLTSHPLLVPWSRKSRAKPLLPLWAVRPVQSLSASTRVHLTLFILMAICFGPSYRQPTILQKLNQGYMQCNHGVWNPTILTFILKYMSNIENCLKFNSF